MALSIELLKQRTLILQACQSLEDMDNRSLRETVKTIKRLGDQLFEKTNDGAWSILKTGVFGGLTTIVGQFMPVEQLKMLLDVVGKGISHQGTEMVKQLNSAETARIQNLQQIANHELQQAVRTLEKIAQFINQNDQHTETVQRSSFAGFAASGR
jgi:hypothetical protein